jgi:AcrR family transcriptional regulator
MKSAAVHPPVKTAGASSHDRLLAAAACVFARDGLQGATTRGIAQEAGVNEVTLFRHFQNKERLLAAVLERAVTAQQHALADESFWTGDLEGDLRNYAAAFNAVLEENELLIRTLIGEARRHPEHARQVIMEATRASRERFISYLASACEAGHVRRDIDLFAAADAFTGMLLSGMLRRTAQKALHYSSDTYVATCVDLFVRGIRAERRKGGGPRR